MTLILGCTIKFIDEDETLRALLCCSRDMNEILQPEVLKQALLRSSQERLATKRRQLWIKLLKIDMKQVPREFAEYRKKAGSLMTKQLQAAIQVDINRSFTTIKEITADNLSHILNAYAVVNP